MRNDVWQAGPQQDVEFQKPASPAVTIPKGVYPFDIDMGHNCLDHCFPEALSCILVMKFFPEPVAKIFYKLRDLYMAWRKTGADMPTVFPKFPGYGIEMLSQILPNHLVKMPDQIGSDQGNLVFTYNLMEQEVESFQDVLHFDFQVFLAGWQAPSLLKSLDFLFAQCISFNGGGLPVPPFARTSSRVLSDLPAAKGSASALERKHGTHQACRPTLLIFPIFFGKICGYNPSFCNCFCHFSKTKGI